MTTETLARIMARHSLDRRDVLIVVIFARGHPEQSFSLALKRYIAGEGPAAVAAGRTMRQQTSREVAA